MGTFGSVAAFPGAKRVPALLFGSLALIVAQPALAAEAAATGESEEDQSMSTGSDRNRQGKDGDALPHERGWIEVSAFLPGVDTQVRLDSADGLQGTVIDFENDLRLSRRKVLPAVSAGVWFSRNWALVGEFYDLSRSQDATLEEEIVFDGEVFPASADVAGQFGSQVFRLGVRHSIHRDENTEVAVALGAHVTTFAVAIEGEVAAGGASASTARRRREVLAPLPTIGLHLRQQIAPRIDIGLNADAFRLDLGDVEGRIVNLEATASYRIGRNFALGVAWRRIDYQVDVAKTDWSGRAEYGFSGPSVSLRYAW